MEDRADYGTELKYAVNITAKGFDINEDSFEIDLYCGPKKLHFDKADLRVGSDNQYYLCFNSKDIGPGIVTAVITAHVPDTDFNDNVRDEVVSFFLINIKKWIVK